MTSNEFLELLPQKPYAADAAQFQRIVPRETAITKRLIQANHPLFLRWLLLDIDREDAYESHDRFCYEPHFISLNRDNGHAHLLYQVASGVSIGEKSHREPINLFKDVLHGLQKRLGADPSYSGHLVKNPYHPHWATHAQAVMPYDLVRLADSLDKSEKSRTRGLTIGIGRNCTIFERLRKDAYREVLPFKRSNRSREDFQGVMFDDAMRMNARFAQPLTRQEVLGIAKSVSKWVWDKFTVEKFSQIQTKRIQSRWKGEPLTKTKPWEPLGISRKTWYKRRKQGTLDYPDMVLSPLSGMERLTETKNTPQRDYKLIIPSRPTATQNPSCPLEAGELS
jgi:hypothetical protein